MMRDTVFKSKLTAGALSLAGLGLGFWLAGFGQWALAQEPASEASEPAIASQPFAPSTEPLDLDVVEQGTSASDRPVVTIHTISQTSLTPPSLWWAREQFGSRLLDNWLAYPEAQGRNRRVDLVVNRQLWSLLDYLERYQFVHYMGTVARDYGYNTRVFNRQGALLAAYTCNFASIEPIPIQGVSTAQKYPTTDNLTCQVDLDSTERAGRFRGRSSQPGEFPSIMNGTEQP